MRTYVIRHTPYVIRHTSSDTSPVTRATSATRPPSPPDVEYHSFEDHSFEDHARQLRPLGCDAIHAPRRGRPLASAAAAAAAAAATAAAEQHPGMWHHRFKPRWICIYRYSSIGWRQKQQQEKGRRTHVGCVENHARLSQPVNMRRFVDLMPRTCTGQHQAANYPRPPPAPKGKRKQGHVCTSHLRCVANISAVT